MNNLFNFMEQPTQQSSESTAWYNPNLQQFIDSQLNTIDLQTPKQYREFRIPKAAGGFRKITAPEPELKTIQDTLLKILKGINLQPHPAVHSYRQQRSSLTAMQQHQTNGSKWFLKLDIKDFFPSATPEMVLEELRIALPNQLRLQETLRKFAFRDNGLPQGAPTSPFLSNLVLTRFDLALSEYLTRFPSKQYCYTRYADDLLISSPTDFQYNKIVNFIKEELDKYGFQLKLEKLRYGSSAGRNWNLGIMLNKDGNLTIGHERKRKLKIALNNLFSAYKQWKRPLPEELAEEAKAYCLENMSSVNGEYSYFAQIEPEYAKSVLTKYEEKYNILFKHMRKELL